MLEGLEVSVLMLSEIYNQKYSTFRFDSEHYQKKYQTIIKKLEKHRNLFDLKDLISQPVITGHTPSMKVDRYYNGNVKFIKTDNLRENKITQDFTHYLSKEGNDTLKNSQLRKDDIITTIVGATYEIVGRTSIIQERILPASINQNIALIRPDINKINSHFLNIYLNTFYGRNMLYYHSRQTGQVNLNCREVEYIKVPVFKNLEIQIEKVVKEIEVYKHNSKQTYAEAENLLLAELSLQDFAPSKEKVSVKSFSESFGTSGRLDAEYYQVKYEDYLKLIRNYKNGFDTIRSVCSLKGDNFKLKDEKEYRYIELSNIGNTGDVNGCTINFGKELPSRARRLVNKDDVIISSIEGSLDSCALITEEYSNALCSTGFYVINSEKINSETLLVLFKSKLMQNVLKQNCSGTILTGMNKDDFLNIIIPIIDFEKQQKIASLIEESFSLKKQSEHLLEVAKRAVEMAIEENETVAIKYIQNESNNYYF